MFGKNYVMLSNVTFILTQIRMQIRMHMKNNSCKPKLKNKDEKGKRACIPV